MQIFAHPFFALAFWSFTYLGTVCFLYVFNPRFFLTIMTYVDFGIFIFEQPFF